MIKSISLSFLTIFLLASCSSDDDNSAAVENLEVPATYTFERNGESTVSYSGQTTRITMAKALAGQMMDETSSEEQLLNMLNNENNPFTEEELNTSSKNIKSKLAASAEYFSTNTVESNAYKQDFENFLINQANEVYPNWNTLAEAGIAGQVIDGSKTRYISGKGLEYNQAYLKGLMGALLSDQMLNNYLSSLVLDEGDNKANNDAEIVEEVDAAMQDTDKESEEEVEVVDELNSEDAEQIEAEAADELNSDDVEDEEDSDNEEELGSTFGASSDSFSEASESAQHYA